MKGAAWHSGLTVLVLGALWTVSPAEQMRRESQPRSRATSSPAMDGYAPGHRAVWASEAPLESLLRPGDRRVEVVTSDLDPTWHTRGADAIEPPLETAPRRANLVLLLTVTDLKVTPVDTAAARIGDAPRIRTDRVIARVDEVIKNRSLRPVLAGTSIVFSYDGGGEIEIGGVRVATRVSWERLPRRGRRYLWFLSANRDSVFGGLATNAFDITGRRVSPLAKLRRFAGLPPMPTAAALDLVRRRVTLPEMAEYEQISYPERQRGVYRFVRTAVR